MSKKTRYVQVGVGGRASFFYDAIAGKYNDTAELLAFCDINRTRLELARDKIVKEFGANPVNLYKNSEFDEMIRREKPDCVIVTTIDRTHHHYIIRAMELGCDVICEKPMTIDEEKCQTILDTIKRTGRRLRITFNYRYSPHNTKIRELIMNDCIGKVHSIHFEWLLNTEHGADYFRRWHRDKRNSGGLLVHKATHHFDLVNFWIGSAPKTVFAMGDLLFYGRANAEERGVDKFYHRGTEDKSEDPFALHLDRNKNLKAMYLDAEKEDGYLRDQSVFGDGISIEDSIGVLVRYNNKAIMTYSLNAYMPWEGYRVSFNGPKGRIEVLVAETSYINAGSERTKEGAVKNKTIHVLPIFGKPYEVDIPPAKGGHGGGDTVLLEDIFGNPGPDPFHRAASHIEGAMSILTGIAANRSIATGLPVNIKDLVQF